MDLATKKRRHHFVWQHYLRAWAIDGRIFCRRSDGTIFETATSNIGVAKDFYRLKEITAEDVEFVEKACIQVAPVPIQPLLRKWIPLFGGLFQLRGSLERLGMRIDSPQSVELFDIAANNIEEELHSAIEGRAIPQLDALRAGRTDFLTDPEELVQFCYYICVQFMRTRNRRERMLSQFAGFDLGGVSMERSWGLISHVIATTIAHTIFLQSDSISFTLLTSPQQALISADQPVINLHSVGNPSGGEVRELSFYYPLSPRSALLMEMEQPGNSVSTRVVSVQEAVNFNLAMLDQSLEQTYAATEQDLLALRSP